MTSMVVDFFTFKEGKISTKVEITKYYLPKLLKFHSILDHLYGWVFCPFYEVLLLFVCFLVLGTYNTEQG